MTKQIKVRAPMLVLVTAAAGLVLAACGSSGPGPDTAQGINSGTTTFSHSGSASPSAATPTASASHPLSFYAAQYLRIVAPANAGLDKLNALVNDTAAQQQPTATKAATLVQGADDQLLRAQWPAGVLADIKAQVTADGPITSDLQDLADTDTDTFNHDGASASSAANIVRSDLGLPSDS